MILDNDTAMHQRAHLNFSINARLKQNVFHALEKNQQKMMILCLLSCLPLALSLPRHEAAGLRQNSPLWLQRCDQAEFYGNDPDTSDCDFVAENNYCNEEFALWKCCGSCRKAMEERDPGCYDEEKGCLENKDTFCNTPGWEKYANGCKKSCGLC